MRILETNRHCFSCARAGAHLRLPFRTHEGAGYNVICRRCMTSEIEEWSWEELRALAQERRLRNPESPLQLPEILPLNLAELDDAPTMTRIGAAGLDCIRCGSLQLHDVLRIEDRFRWEIGYACRGCGQDRIAGQQEWAEMPEVEVAVCR